MGISAYSTYLEIYKDMPPCFVESCIRQSADRCQCGMIDGIVPHDILNCKHFEFIKMEGTSGTTKTTANLSM